MPTVFRRAGPLRPHLAAALGEQIARTELRIAEVWQGMSRSATAMSADIGALADAQLPAADLLCDLVSRALTLPEPTPEQVRKQTRATSVDAEAVTLAGRE
jgi:hypothetical protein